MLSDSSSEKLLSHIIKLLEGIDISKPNEDKEVLMEKAREIQKYYLMR